MEGHALLVGLLAHYQHYVTPQRIHVELNRERTIYAKQKMI